MCYDILMIDNIVFIKIILVENIKQEKLIFFLKGVDFGRIICDIVGIEPVRYIVTTQL
jgi:hypothetical protein